MKVFKITDAETVMYCKHIFRFALSSVGLNSLKRDF